MAPKKESAEKRVARKKGDKEKCPPITGDKIYAYDLSAGKCVQMKDVKPVYFEERRGIRYRFAGISPVTGKGMSLLAKEAVVRAYAKKHGMEVKKVETKEKPAKKSCKDKYDACLEAAAAKKKKKPKAVGKKPRSKKKIEKEESSDEEEFEVEEETLVIPKKKAGKKSK
jgi:hypothetical protein